MITIDNDMRLAIQDAVTELITVAAPLDMEEKLKVINAAEILAFLVAD